MGVYDGLIAIVFLFSIAITIPTFYMFFDQVVTNIETINTDGNLVVDSAPVSSFRDSLLIFDAGVLFILGALLVASFFTTFLIRSHPILLVPAFFLFIINVALAAFFTNTYQGFVTNNALIASAAGNFPIIVTLVNNLPVISLISMALGAIFQFGKTPEEYPVGI